jgi:hypothetical protein
MAPKGRDLTKTHLVNYFRRGGSSLIRGIGGVRFLWGRQNFCTQRMGGSQFLRKIGKKLSIAPEPGIMRETLNILIFWDLLLLGLRIYHQPPGRR